MTAPAPRPADAAQAGDAELLALAGQCVKCGLCLPHCPTYRIAPQEGESPRGRIALIEGWVRGELATTPRLDAHLDRCLTCRACELACPSLVEFGRLMDAARARRVAALPRWRRWLRRYRLKALGSQRLLHWGATLVSRYRRSGLARRRPVAGLHRWRPVQAAARLALTLTPAAAGPVRRVCGPDVYLLPGCGGMTAPGAGPEAALRVLEALGVRAGLPSGPVCCGALYRHQGLAADAEGALRGLIAESGGRPLLGMASACLVEYRQGAPDAQATELCAFVDRLRWPAAARLAPLPRRVLIHAPCTHRLLPEANLAVHRLLRRIPAVELAALPGNDTCCGSAGTYMLDQPAASQRLLQPKIAQLRVLEPDILVTTNPGCALHLAAGIREAGLRIEVCHPIALIDRQLRLAAGA